MRFIQEFGYNIKVGQEEAHQQWLTENEAKLAAAAPAGTKYLGTFRDGLQLREGIGLDATIFDPER